MALLRMVDEIGGEVGGSPWATARRLSFTAERKSFNATGPVSTTGEGDGAEDGEIRTVGVGGRSAAFWQPANSSRAAVRAKALRRALMPR